MYNDKYAIKKFEEFQKLPFDTIVETGTWKGDGTLWFLKYRDTVVTIEIDPLYYVEAIENFKKKGYKVIHEVTYDEIKLKVLGKDSKEIYAYYGDSVEVLELVLGSEHSFGKLFIYLDAHWDAKQNPREIYWPILRELRVIAKHTNDCYIIIHDVKHPTKDFGFDSFQGYRVDAIDLTYDYLKEDLLKIKEFKVEFNEEAEENGRGILYAT